MELVKVYSAANELDAEMLKSILEDEGIAVMISAETYGRLLGGAFGASVIGEIRVLVRPEDAERAAGIISEVRIEGDGPDEGLR
ncbi:MAG: DUF2007 domain-containing protein [Dehalococcoidia bacterium]